jgi:spore maturation protein CgeB
MRIAFYGSSLLSAYWNGAATYYRGLLAALARRGWQIAFYEPDAFDRQSHRDIEPPDWAAVRVYPANADAVESVLREAARADVAIKASGVGVFDTELLQGVLRHAAPGALRVFWDVDAPATLAEIAPDAAHPLRRALGGLDAVLTYGGGAPVVNAYTAIGATLCRPIYNALDPATHYPVPPDPEFATDLCFLANRMPDREARADEFFFRAAERCPQRRFLLGGNGWDGKPMPPNLRWIGHVGTQRHNAFNASALAVLNVARESMAAMGFCPATRVFEAAGAGACLITDAWEGVELFLQPGTEVLVARDGADVAEQLAALRPETARAIGDRARRRVLAQHTYEQRAEEVDALFRTLLARKRQMAAA